MVILPMITLLSHNVNIQKLGYITLSSLNFKEGRGSEDVGLGLPVERLGGEQVEKLRYIPTDREELR
ncbi:MAG: hypothetical protein MjAS7_0016 [Metallosphaera javensis (ex Sakai et al. 2022)]|nr:MAG: hypothetical protein MjAS7_0016 [Metallosphaera javensis (ex Sakai et al. 2022)]